MSIEIIQNKKQLPNVIVHAHSNNGFEHTFVDVDNILGQCSSNVSLTYTIIN